MMRRHAAFFSERGRHSLSARALHYISCMYYPAGRTKTETACILHCAMYRFRREMQASGLCLLSPWVARRLNLSTVYVSCFRTELN